MILSITGLKLVVAAVIFATGLVSTFLPMFIKDTSNVYFSLGNMMASGVLLAAGLVHQLGDATETLEKHSSFPMAPFLAGATFIAFLVFEETIHMAFSHTHDEHGCESARPTTRDATETIAASIAVRKSVDENDADSSATYKPLSSSGVDRRRRKDSGASSSIHSGEGRKKHHHDHANHAAGKTDVHHDASDHDARDHHRHHHHHHHHHVGEDHHHEDHGDYSRSKRKNSTHCVSTERRLSRTGAELLVEIERHHHHDDHVTMHLHGSLFASAILFVALSVHSILAGLSIGFVNNIDSISSTAIAVVAHKGFAGYALGSAMVAANADRHRHVILSGLFAMSTPLGIFIGMLTRDFIGKDSLTTGVIKSLVAGTFLYISIIEVGMKELLICRQDTPAAGDSRHKGSGLSEGKIEALKLGTLTMGYGLMSLLAIWV